jgi:hypothetical protein
MAQTDITMFTTAAAVINMLVIDRHCTLRLMKIIAEKPTQQ